jgi:ATP-dependent Zn protease
MAKTKSAPVRLTNKKPSSRPKRRVSPAKVQLHRKPKKSGNKAASPRRRRRAGDKTAVAGKDRAAIQRKAAEATAFHEAGHAVALFAAGLSAETVCIVPGKGYSGYCVHPSVYEYITANRRERRSIARDYIIVSYAGMAAQRLVDPEPNKYHGQNDDVSAFNLSRQFQVFPRRMAYVGDELHDAFLGRLRREAEQLVRRHRRSIEVLAEALLRNKTMTGERMHALVKPIIESREQS